MVCISISQKLSELLLMAMKQIDFDSCTTIADVLRSRATATPMRQAVHFLPTGDSNEQFSLCYHDLDRAASGIAEVLKSRYPFGSRCMLAFPAGFDFLKAFFGCLYAGMVPVPTAPSERKQALVKFIAIAQAADPVATLTTQQYLDKMIALNDQAEPPAGIECMATDCIASLDTLGPAPLATPEGIAFLQFTSGSTGQPKGVMVRHRNLWENSIAINHAMAPSAKSHVLSWLPAFHDMGLIGGLMQPFFSGAEVTLMSPRAFLQRPLRWLEQISKRRITHSGGPNFAYQMCVAAANEDVEKLDLSSWSVAFNGAEPIDARVLDSFSKHFKPAGFSPQAHMPCYGLAENTLLVSAVHREQLPSTIAVDRKKLAVGTILESTNASAQRITSCGTPAKGVVVRIVDVATGDEVGDDCVGEIWVSGSSMAAGYWALEQATLETFGARLPGREERYLRTGDLGFLRKGQLYITGRLKDLIIIRGRNYYPQDIERTASLSDPALVASGCAVFSVDQDGLAGLVVVQEVKRQALKRLDGAALCERIRAAVAAQEGLTLTDILLVKPMVLPRTSSGKIQRHQCLNQFINDETYGIVYHHTNNPTQAVQRQAGEETLSVNEVANWLREQIARRTQKQPHEIDLERPFEEFGLDSAVLVELSALLSERMNIDLPPELLFEHTTLHAVQAALLNSEDMASVDFDMEMKLDPSVTLSSPYAGFSPPKKILITGATGFVAAYLLSELIQGNVTELICLVRCRDAAHGLERVRNNLARYGHHSDNLSSLLTAIPADPSQPRLGLDTATYEKLSQEVDTVLHCAGEPGWQKPYRALRDINVGATREVLTFSCTGRTKTVHHLSTITIFEMKDGGCFEDCIPDPQNAHGRGYNQSKAVADRLCLTAMERGLPVTIYRFPFAMGSVQTGQIPMQITIPQLVKGIVEMGLMPLENAAVNLVPVDYLAKTIAALMQRAGSERRCFHIVNRKQLGMKDLARVLTAFGYQCRRVPYDVWKTLVAEERNVHLLPLLPLLNAYSVSALVSDFLIDPTNTYTALHQDRPELLETMPTSVDCISALLRYAVDKGELQPGEATPEQTDKETAKAPMVDYPKLPKGKPNDSHAITLKHRVIGKQARAIAQRTDRPETFFRVLFADALRRWSQQPKLGLAAATANVAGMESSFEWVAYAIDNSLLDGCPFDQHLREANQAQKQPLWWLRMEEDAPLPVAFAYLERTSTEPRDDRFLSQFQHALREELERENCALSCEINSFDVGWEIQWQLAPSVEAALLKNAFAYFLACIDRLCCADWTAPLGFEVLASFIGLTALDNHTETQDTGAVSIHETFLEQAERTPNAMAVRHASGNLTYDELKAQVICLANHIAQQVSGNECLIGLYCNRNPSAIVGMLAIGLSGHAFVPLDPSYPEDRLSMMLEQSEAPLVLSDEDLRVQATGLAPEGTVVVSIDHVLASEEPSSFKPIPTHAHQLMYVMFTSGSTGRPKGVMIEQHSVVNFVRSVADTMGAEALGDWMAVSSFSFDISLMELFVPLTTGLCVVLASSEQARNAQQLRELIDTTTPRVMHATPATWTMLLNAGFTNQTDMLVVSGADTFGEGLKNRLCDLGCSVWNFYGPTETTIYSSVKKIIPSEPVSIGKPLANTVLYVLDHDLQPAPVGVPGELYIGGEGLARGFLHQPNLTAERFVYRSVVGQPPTRYFRTGDLARLLPNGDIDCMGRLDNQIKLRGYRIEIGEIESVIDAHELVNESAVVVQGTGEHRQLSAFVVPVADQKQQVDDQVHTSMLQEHREVWDYTYSKPEDLEHEAGFWVSSYNGKPLSEVEMDNFFDTTAASILDMVPCRVLEIGCGNGLLACRLCPSVAHYTGLDFSHAALQQAQQRLDEAGVGNASLRHGDARQLSDVRFADYDFVVLNSVVQYFPSRSYLQSVLNQLIEGAGEGELTIFVGDVRDLARAEEFYRYAAFQRACPGTSFGAICREAEVLASRERELLLDASFFSELSDRFPQVTAVTIQAHSSTLTNEMTQFRYHVLIRVNHKADCINDADKLSWQSMFSTHQALAVREGAPLVMVGVPDARRLPVQQVIETLSQEADEHTTLSYQLCEALQFCEGVDLMELSTMASNAGFTTTYSHCGAKSGTVTAFFKANDDAREWNQQFSHQVLDTLANNPMDAIWRARLTASLKETLQRALPSYMVPQLNLVSELPFTANGKINRRALMELENARGDRELVSPRNEVEHQLLPIFQEVLGDIQVGVVDNFFDLGGNSILAVQLMTQLNDALGTHIVLQPLFRGHNTVEKLAKLVEAERTVIQSK